MELTRSDPSLCARQSCRVAQRSASAWVSSLGEGVGGRHSEAPNEPRGLGRSFQMPSSQTDPLPRGQTLHLRAPVPINTDALPPAHRPSSSPSPSPTRGLELLITLAGHRSAPSLRLRKGRWKRRGPEQALPECRLPASQPGRLTKVRRQVPASPCTWDSLPEGTNAQPECS